MGRSVNTGNLTLVLYEDPPDGIPKIHVRSGKELNKLYWVWKKFLCRSKKYMAWIAEAGLPVHMHVEKVRFLLQSEAKVWPSIFQGKSLQFDQWRIAHLAEFGINNFDSPSTPAPSRHGQGQERTKDSAKRPPRTPKSKRKEKSEREASERKAKTRRDSEPAQQPEEETEKAHLSINSWPMTTSAL